MDEYQRSRESTAALLRPCNSSALAAQCEQDGIDSLEGISSAAEMPELEEVEAEQEGEGGGGDD